MNTSFLIVLFIGVLSFVLYGYEQSHLSYSGQREMQDCNGVVIPESTQPNAVDGPYISGTPTIQEDNYTMYIHHWEYLLL